MINVHPLFTEKTHESAHQVFGPPPVRVWTSSPEKFHPANGYILCTHGGGLPNGILYQQFNRGESKLTKELQYHEPVLLSVILDLISSVPSGIVMDATLGTAGHAEAILKSRKDLKLIGIDRDPLALEIAQKRLDQFKNRIKLINACFSSLSSLAEENPVFILFDLGVSSLQLEDSSRGFSFKYDTLLDMRMGLNTNLRACDVLNNYTERDLIKILLENGEPFGIARKIVHEVLKKRPLYSTTELVEIIQRIKKRPYSKIHPATKVFQAIRREVNQEDAELKAGLSSASEILAPGGIIAVISYHSLEDAVVKKFFDEISGYNTRDSYEKSFELIYRRKAIKPEPDEVAKNPRSRSARLRAARRLK